VGKFLLLLVFDVFALVWMDYFRGVLGISVVFIKDYLRLLISYFARKVLFWRILGLCFERFLPRRMRRR